MKYFKLTVGVVILICFIAILYNFHEISIYLPDLALKGSTIQHVPLNELYDDARETHREQGAGLVIDTLGCKIPITKLPYAKQIFKSKQKPGSCGKRAVFLKKIKKNQIQVKINSKSISGYLKNSSNVECCYRFILKSLQPGLDTTRIQYTPCNKIKDGSIFTLTEDFINVRCSQNYKINETNVVYDDFYGFINPKTVSKRPNNCKSKYNILLLGIDSMSSQRLVQTMPRTTAFLEEKLWLSFKGYHKIGDNTLPNLMAAFTGKNITTITEMCSGKMDDCNEHLIWNTFKQDGYVTAYGEDFLRLPDTFHSKFMFQKPPTDHYMRPLFMSSEIELFNRSLVCSGKVPSGQQLLDYALDFAITYNSDLFFGIFWMNSFSHNINSRPQYSDKMFEGFFNRLQSSGVLNNTFVIFFSDHGLRFGKNRLKVESYYDERLPFLFIEIPAAFKLRESAKVNYADINQYRLITPYDLFNTMVDIYKTSSCSNVSVGVYSDDCPKCHSLFNLVSANRTCEDAGIHDKWCSCHQLYPLDVHDSDALKSVLLVVSFIKSRVHEAKAKRCWSCVKLTLKNVIRIHYYYNNDNINTKQYYVVAFSMSPGNVMYEATVLRNEEKIRLIGSVSIISPYRGLGKCVINPKDRLYCVCQKTENCRIKS